MIWYLIRRLLLVIPTLIGVAIAVFFLIRVMPGDVVVVKLRADGANVSDETIEAERKRLGLDKPLYSQFGDYMVGLAQFDLGKSLWTGESVNKEIALERLRDATHPGAVEPGTRGATPDAPTGSSTRSGGCRR